MFKEDRSGSHQEGSPMTETTLPQLILTVQATMHDPDPHSLAKEVLANLKPEDYQDALFEALPTYVRHVLVRERNAAMNSQPFDGSDEETASPQRRIVGVSKKVRAAQWWARLLDSRLTTEGGVWKRLGDCTRLDLERAAQRRETQAASLLVRAGQFHQLAELLGDDLVTVGSLDAGQVAPIFGLVAA